MKKYIYLTLVLLLPLAIFTTKAVDGAVGNATYKVRMYCKDDCKYDTGSQWNGETQIEIIGFKGVLNGTVNKEVNLLRADNSIVPLSFNLGLGEEVKIENKDSVGSWYIEGGPYDSPPSDGILYQQFTKKDRKFYFGTSAPMDDGNISVSSSNPDVVSCTNSGCKGIKAGEAKINISFPVRDVDTRNNAAACEADATKYASCTQDIGSCRNASNLNDWLKCLNSIPKICTSREYKVYKTNCLVRPDESAYGFVNVQAKTVDNHGTLNYSAAKTYKINSIQFTAKVGENGPHNSSCASISNVTRTGATVNWSYSDPNGDPQTNYQVQISEDSEFDGDPVVAVTKGSATDVSKVFSAAVTGLTASTTYYARVRTFNDTDQWSSYSTCSQSFTTVGDICPNGQPPVNGSCDDGDMCRNIDGIQTIVPSSTNRIGDNCTCKNGADNPPDCDECAAGFVNGQCGSGDVDPVDLLEFRISPSITSGSSCPFYLRATGVSYCEIQNRVNAKTEWFDEEDGIVNGTININGGGSVLPIGTYRLFCKGLEANPQLKPFGTVQSCRSNSDIRED